MVIPPALSRGRLLNAGISPSTTLQFNLLQEFQGPAITALLQEFPDVVDVGMDKEQFVQAALAVVPRLPDLGKLFLELSPEGIAMLGSVEMAQKHGDQFLGIPVAFDTGKGNVSVRFWYLRAAWHIGFAVGKMADFFRDFDRIHNFSRNFPQ